MIELIDTHAHLYEISDLKQVLKRAKDFGITKVISVSSNLETSKINLKLSNQYNEPKIYLALGIHPQNLAIEELEELKLLIAKNIKCIVALGEIGLDFWIKEAKQEDKKNLQIKILEEQLDLAYNFGFPVIIHSRGAWKECFEIISSIDIKKVVFHWYSGPLDILKEIIERGYFISATPSCEYSRQHQEAIKYTPLENLLLETDSPLIYKEWQAEPKDILKVLKGVASLKSISEEKLAKITTQNAIELFNLK
ncbi:MAG: TatD family hydrolase [Candidatus Omnitrophica bacterium]|nr:TatD family hydrolase [Candidatus Omnitrophota bacterium]MCM8799349.1 TatD family hydrolase [Candidatus Omnitrophota bacterium]